MVQAEKYQINQQTEEGLKVLHPETEASIVQLDNTAAGMSATNAQDAFKEVMDILEEVIGGGVVTGIKGENEVDYRKGQVNITKDNIGLGQVNNTSDANKPVSTAQRAALDLKADKTELANYIPTSQKGTTNGVATLDSTGKIPSSQLPSYVDDVLEFDNRVAFPPTGEEGKIYVAKDTNKTYRWSGSDYAPVGSDLALGETSSTAYPGNKGKKNADDIAAIISGSKKVGSATTADSATTAETATNATNSTNATNVTTTINGKNITDIFETDGVKVKKATKADSATTATTAVTANKLATPQAINVSGDATGTANFDGSAPANIAVTLKNVGTSGTYSVVTTDAQGRVTQGGNLLEIGTVEQNEPTAKLAIGGLFFKKL